MLRPGMTGQNRRTQGALVAHPLQQENYTGVEMDMGTFYEIFSLKPSLMQEVCTNARIPNKFMWRHLLTKFASYKVPPVMVSTHGSVVPLAMFNF